MSISLTQILDLVGRLDDAPGDETPRERFRRFLQENARELGQVRDYIEECLRDTGEQYHRALQDLVNHLGGFLGFEVTFGRYQGVQGEVGLDGHWRSPKTDFHIVVEVKTTEVYAVKTTALVGYVDELISQKKIRSWDNALGLYIVGRPDPQIKQLENAIVAEKRTDQLRVISVESLLVLADLMDKYDVEHEDILALMQPSGPTIDSIVDLMERLVVGARTEEPPSSQEGTVVPPAVSETEAAYWLTPVKSLKEETAEDCIRALVGEEHIYAFGDRTPGRKRLKPGDWICFYANQKGVIAHARVASFPEHKPHPRVRFSEKYPWVFRLDSVSVYPDRPVAIDHATRAQMDAFKGRDLSKSWAWLVQGTKTISEQDFNRLARK